MSKVFRYEDFVAYAGSADERTRYFVLKQTNAQLLRLSFLLLCASALAMSGERLPLITGTSLSGAAVAVPEPAPGRPMILLFGFSRKSGEQVQQWAKRVAADFGSDSRMGCYDFAVLEGVPGFVKPMILHAMKKDLPEKEQTHFVPLYQHAAELKMLTGYKDADAAYVLVTDAAGEVIWKAHGLPNDLTYGQMKQAAEKASAGRKTLQSLP